jgi:hypothetical protein
LISLLGYFTQNAREISPVAFWGRTVNQTDVRFTPARATTASSAGL